MSRRIPKSNGTREAAPEGTYPAILVGFYDMGTQVTTYQGNEREVRQCQFKWEFPELKTKDGKAICEYSKYTYSDSPKGNLMKDLKSWKNIKDGNVDPDTLLGQPALVTVTHSDKPDGSGVWVNLSVGGVPKGMKVKKPTEPIQSLYLDEGFDEEVFNSLPQWMQEKIASTKEYETIIAEKQNSKNNKKGKR